MSAKNVDRHNRFRNITVGFRVSPEEQAELNRAVALSGLSKQEYCYRRCMERDVVVQGNPRVYKALKNQMADVLAELQRIEAGNNVSDDLLNIIELITVTMDGLKEMLQMTNKKEMTAPCVSVGEDTEQSFQKCSNNIIPQNDENINSLEKMQRELRKMLDPSYLKTMSMTELYDTVFQSRPPLIDGLLYPGTYLFVGAPKLGKSFLMAQLAYHISTGTPLWNYTVRKGTVLYLALEDDYRRLQERLYRMFGTDGAEDLFFSVSAGQLGNGLDEQLTRFMQEHPDTKLIIIDTLQKVREVGGDNYSYANDYEIITRLKKFADSYGITLLLVHHTRKQKADDTFDMISGTNGLLGAADGAFLLQKEKRTGITATLEVSGRDQQDQRLHLKRNENTLAWNLEQLETELWKEPPEPLLEFIAEKITADNSSWEGTPTALAEWLAVDLKPNALTMKLNINAGRLYNEYGIRYENKRCHDGRKVRLYLEQA